MNFLESIILVLGLVNFMRLTALNILTFVFDSGSHILAHESIQKLQSHTPSTHINSKYKYKPLISIIIAAYNEDKVIIRTLKALFKSTYKKIEVIIVNDGSHDLTELKVQEYIAQNPKHKIRYIYQENQGKAHALNRALKDYVTGELVMSLDADSVARKDALANAIKYFRNRYVKALATNVKILPSYNLMGMIQRMEYLMGYHLKKALTAGNFDYIIGGVGSIFRTSIVKAVGFYDTDTITEDIDLTMKLVQRGNKKNLLVYAEDVVVHTESALSVRALFRQRYRWKLGRFQTFWKNRNIFFNTNEKYTKFLTFVYLPFQLFSELTFLFDPLFMGYIAYLSIKYASITSYYGMFVFFMVFTTIAVATDNESDFKEKCLMLLITPFSYLLFFVVSIVEYVGLIHCIINWKQIIYAKEYNHCAWVPIARAGIESRVH